MLKCKKAQPWCNLVLVQWHHPPPLPLHTLHTTVHSNYFKEERKSLKRLNSFHTVSSVNILSSVLHILISLLSEASSGSYLIAAKLISMVNYWSHQVASGFNCNIWNGSSTAMGQYFNIHLDYNAIRHCIKTIDLNTVKQNILEINIKMLLHEEY